MEMNIRKLIYAVLMSISFIANAGNGGMSIGEYKRFMAEPDSEGTLQIYINGLWEGISWMDAKNAAYSQKQLYCPPKGVTLSGVDIKGAVDFYAAGAKLDDAYPVAFVIFDSVKALYPCKK
jgi:hypothetical protein